MRTENEQVTEPAGGFSLLRRRDAALALAGYVIGELERDRPLMTILEDPAVVAMVEGREYPLGDLACDGLFLEAVRLQRLRSETQDADRFPAAASSREPDEATVLAAA